MLPSALAGALNSPRAGPRKPGVRTAIYTQNLLSFLPATWALKDNKATNTELHAIEAQSVTILISAFAILISTIIQSQLFDLSTFPALVVLNLSWTNYTNTFIYFLLYVHHNSESNGRTGLQRLFHAIFTLRGLLPPSPNTSNVESRGEGANDAEWMKTPRRGVVFGLGSLHLTLMSSIGLWIWSNPCSFKLRSTHRTCSVDNTRISVFFNRFSLFSEALRRVSHTAYSLILVPGINFLLPAVFSLGIQLVYHYIMKMFYFKTRPGPIPALIGLCILACVNLIILVDIEISIGEVLSIQDPGESDWTFGQVLALLLLCLPLRDAIMFASLKSGLVEFLNEIRGFRAKQGRDDKRQSGAESEDLYTRDWYIRYDPESKV